MINLKRSKRINFFTFASTSLAHVIAAKEEGMWAFRYQDNPSTNKRNITKASRYARAGDYALFYCSEDGSQGVVAVAQITEDPIQIKEDGSLPTAEELRVDSSLWDENEEWFLPIKLNFLTPIRRRNIVTRETMYIVDGLEETEQCPLNKFINVFIGPVPTKVFVPLDYMTSEKFLMIQTYLLTGQLLES